MPVTPTSVRRLVKMLAVVPSHLTEARRIHHYLRSRQVMAPQFSEVSAMSEDSSWWREQAACRSINPELFFPLSETGLSQHQIREARRVCNGCLVQLTCLTWAAQHSMNEGIWGGRTASERRAMLADQAAVRQCVGSIPRQQDGRGRRGP